MDFLNALYKKYTQNHIGNIFIIASVCLGYIFLAPSQDCPVNWDCNSYISMVDSISYDSSISPHHAMRILPTFIVKSFVTLFGVSIEQGFNIISGLSYLTFSLGFYYVLNKLISLRSKKYFEFKLFILSITLLVMASHHAVIQALVNVYQATDALTYPIVLFMFYFTYYKKQFHWVFILTLLGIVARQNLFFMGELCLLYGLLIDKKIINLVYIAIAALSYHLLVTYYHAGDMLLATVTPQNGFFNINHLLFVILDSGILTLITPIFPLAIFILKDLILFYIKHWYLLLYTGITVGQPFLAYHLTGNNFERIAMQGIWPLYLISGYFFYKKIVENQKNDIMSFILFLYAANLLIIMKFVPKIAEPLRLNLAISFGLMILGITFIQKRKLQKNNLKPTINY